MAYPSRSSFFFFLSSITNNILRGPQIICQCNDSIDPITAFHSPIFALSLYIMQYYIFSPSKRIYGFVSVTCGCFPIEEI